MNWAILTQDASGKSEIYEVAKVTGGDNINASTTEVQLKLVIGLVKKTGGTAPTPVEGDFKIGFGVPNSDGVNAMTDKTIKITVKS